MERTGTDEVSPRRWGGKTSATSPDGKAPPGNISSDEQCEAKHNQEITSSSKAVLKTVEDMEPALLGTTSIL